MATNQKEEVLEALNKYEKNWETAMGAWFPGKKVIFRGKNLHESFFDSEWMALFIYGISGKSLSTNQIKLLNSIWVYTSYPDPRLWNNRISALAGTVRSTGSLAISASIAVSDAFIYGGQVGMQAMDFLIKTRKKLDSNIPLDNIIKDELLKSRRIPGYGRPVVSGDERIKYVMRRAKELELDEGIHVQLAFEIENYLKENRFRFQMNYGAIVSAFFADFEFSIHEYYMWLIPIFMAGMIPCYLDALNHPPGSFFPMRCSSIKYEGLEYRQW